MNKKEAFSLEHFGPIERVSFDVADITVLVGPQATGKSLTLQWFKLAEDQNRILGTLSTFGRDVSGDPSLLAGLYFGGGYRSAYTSQTRVTWRKEALNLQALADGRKRYEEHTVMYVPAHRALLFQSGWPIGFRAFGDDTPLVARAFSEAAHQMLATMNGAAPVFPPQHRFRAELKERLDKALFHGGQVMIEPTGLASKQLHLAHGRTRLSMMEWTTGQREVLPLLLGLLPALPGGAQEKRPRLKYIVVEEPELGLHPDGVIAMMALLLEVVRRGYRLILSTHSSDVLEVLWSMQQLRRAKAPARAFLSLLGVRETPWSRSYATKVLQASQSIVALSHGPSGKVRSTDITKLDPFSEDEAVSEWGGLIRYASRASKIIAEADG